MAINVNVSGTRRTIKAIGVKQGSTRRDIKTIHFNRNAVWHKPTAPQITSFTISPDHIYDDNYRATDPDRTITFNWVISSTPALTALTLEGTRSDGTRTAINIRNLTDTSVSATMFRGDETYTLTATNVNGTSHAVAHFTYRSYPSISRFTRTGFRQNIPNPSRTGTLELSYTATCHPPITSAVITGNDGTTHRASIVRGANNTFTGSAQITRALLGTTQSVIYTLTIRNAFNFATETFTFNWSP